MSRSVAPLPPLNRDGDARLGALLRHVLKRNKLSFSDADLADVVAAIIREGDADGDGSLQFGELEALLAGSGLGLAPDGGLRRLPGGDEDGALDAPGAGAMDPVSFRPPVKGEKPSSEAAPGGCVGGCARGVEDRLLPGFWLALYACANAACFVAWPVEL